MSPFDLPDDDPLLEDDPFSSAPDGGEEGDATHEDEGSKGSLFSSDEAVDSQTIFEEGEAQIVVRSEEDISSGELAGLNAALRHFSRRGLFHLLEKLGELKEILREGWALERIEFRQPPDASLAFILTEESEDG